MRITKYNSDGRKEDKYMGKVSTNISIDPKLKEESIMLLSQFGLDLSTAITLFLQQTVREKRIPFQIGLDIPNKETQEALNELESMKKDKEHYKRYSSFDELLEDCQSSIEEDLKFATAVATIDGVEPSEDAKRLFILYKEGLLDMETVKKALARKHKQDKKDV